MPKKAFSPFTVKVEINQEGFKQLVETGKLSPFMEAFTKAAGNEIKAQITESLAKSVIGKTAIGGISISTNFDADDFWFGNGPPRPWPRGGLAETKIAKEATR